MGDHACALGEGTIKHERGGGDLGQSHGLKTQNDPHPSGAVGAEEGAAGREKGS